MKSNNILFGVFYGLLIFMLFGCASSSVPSSPITHGIDLDIAIREAATQMENRLPSGTTVALVSVASPSTAFSTQVLTRLESAIVSSGKLVVVDRANLDRVREEQGFQLSSEVDDASATSIGQFLGAGAIVTGALTDLGDIYSLTLKAINIETATVAVSYLADLAKTTRIETLLATRDGAGSGGTAVARTQTAAASTSIPSTTTQPQAATPATPPPPVYSIGDIGPAGGIIFYDKGNNSDGWRYLEAAPANTEFTAQWGAYGVWIRPSTGTGIGTGRANTQTIKTILEERGELTRAAHRCTQLNINGFTDWFLPSKAELSLMYVNLKERGLGDFGQGVYCSSSQGTNSFWGHQRVCGQRFSNGEQNDDYDRNATFSVRAIRQF